MKFVTTTTLIKWINSNALVLVLLLITFHSFGILLLLQSNLISSATNNNQNQILIQKPTLIIPSKDKQLPVQIQPIKEDEEVECGSTRETKAKVILIVGVPRSGSTLLYNIARILFELYDPNTISGWDIPANEVEYWKNENNVNVVIKTHDNFKSYLSIADFILFSTRDIRGALCSLHRMGWVNSSNVVRRCQNIGLIIKSISSLKQKNNNYNQVKIETFTHTELTSYKNSNNNGNNNNGELFNLVERVSQTIGLSFCGNQNQRQIYFLVSKLVSELKPIAFPKNDSRAQHPRSLLHNGHLSTSIQATTTTTTTKSNNDNLLDCSEILEFASNDKKCSSYL